MSRKVSRTSGNADKLDTNMASETLHSSPEPICLSDFEEQANQKFSPDARRYFSGGADEEFSLRDNVEAFKR